MTLSQPVEAYSAADQLMRDRLDLYCKKLVKIQTKDGTVKPFVFNEAQRRLHKKLEKQLDARGLVRAIVLKARRLGVSTYVGARFYHRSTLWRGRNTFILTHEDKSTQELFAQVNLIHANMPRDYRPATVAANANELAFADMNGGYRIGTAKNTKGTGRGLTIQLLHGSEVPFWANAEGHFAGLMKAVSLVEGTEVILEGTGNGVGGTFYEQWGLAERGLSDFIPIFLPWYIDPENRHPLPADYEPSFEEEEYAALYKLDDEQLCWLHFENITLGGEPGILCPLFRQENPATAAEAFQTSGTDSLISNEVIIRARAFKAPDQSFLPRVLGIDSARSIGSGDATRIVDRQGRKAGTISMELHTDDEVQIAHEVMKILMANPDIRKAFFDVTGGYGAGAHDICRSNGFEKRVVAVNFGSAAQDTERYINRRVEMWDRGDKWLRDPGGADIPDDDVVHRHLAAPWLLSPDANARKRMAPKEQIKKKFKFSPDWGDAWALTFAELIPVDLPDERPKWMRDLDADGDGSGGDWQST